MAVSNSSSDCSSLLMSQYLDRCEYVDEVPENLTCYICLGGFNDPHLLSCCGIKYCASCINPITLSNKPCPNCRAPQFSTMLDKNLQRAVNNLKIFCVNKINGCDWTGEVIYLPKHVQNKCLCVGVACKYCSKEFSKQLIKVHETDECDGRPLELRVASEIMKMNKRMEQLERECGYWKNETLSLREEMNNDKQQHTDSIEKFKFVLEENQLKHEQETKELKEEMLLLKHESDRVNGDTRKSLKSLNECIPWAQKCQMFTENLERSYRDWQVPIWQTPPPVVFSSCLPPCQFIMNGFTNYRDSGEIWYSPPFYSWPGGYKLCLKVYAKGEHAKYMSVGILELGGEYDDLLESPPRCIVKVSILNMLRNSNHITHHISVESMDKTISSSTSKHHSSSDARKQGKLLSSNSHSKGISPKPLKSKFSSLPAHNAEECGFNNGPSLSIPKFISHASMRENPLTNSKYWSENDCVCFRVDECRQSLN